MNAMVSALKFNVQHSQELCLIHNEFKVQTGGGPICGTCAKELVMNSQSKHEEELTKSVKKKRVGVAMLPSRHIDSGFKNYIVNNEGQKTALGQCFSFAKDLTEGINRNLIMVGRTGTGKTHLSVSVAKNVLHKNKSARYITSEDRKSVV